MTPPDELSVEVTQEDIDAGYRQHAFACPFARAICRLLGVAIYDGIESHVRVSVARKWVSIYPADGTLHQYDLPPGAQLWVGYFDKMGPKGVRPITVTLVKRKDIRQ